jgi:hypothetical protein
MARVFSMLLDLCALLWRAVCADRQHTRARASALVTFRDTARTTASLLCSSRLRNSKLDLEARDGRGQTALYYAYQQKSGKMVRACLIGAVFE